jgi:very-short-patch-repair endonuclease
MLDADHSIAALAASQHGVIARRQLAALGLGASAIRWRLRQGRLERIAREVFALPGAPVTWERRLWAAHLEVGPGSVVAARAAARLHGLPGFDGEPVDLLVPDDHSGRGTLAVVRRTTALPAHHVTTLRGLPCTSVARCLFDLAGTPGIHPGRVERALDTAVARRATILDEFGAVHTLLGGRGRRGATVIRALLQARAPGYVAPESELEARFVRLCAEHDLPLPRRQVTLGRGAPIGRVDFLFPDHGVVVEVDGRAFHDGRLDRERDRWRDNELAALGLRVVRLGWADVVHRPDATTTLLKTAFAAKPAGRRTEPAVMTA